MRQTLDYVKLEQRKPLLYKQKLLKLSNELIGTQASSNKKQENGKKIEHSFYL